MPVARRTIARTARESVPLSEDLVNYLALIPPVFAQAQHSVSNHRKNVVALRKVQEKCAEVTEQGPKGIMLAGEKGFNTKFNECLERVLPVKKGVAVADRVIAFVGKFVAYTTEQGKQHTL
jgi:condensin complex subunit 3